MTWRLLYSETRVAFHFVIPTHLVIVGSEERNVNQLSYGEAQFENIR